MSSFQRVNLYQESTFGTFPSILNIEVPSIQGSGIEGFHCTEFKVVSLLCPHRGLQVHTAVPGPVQWACGGGGPGEGPFAAV